MVIGHVYTALKFAQSAFRPLSFPRIVSIFIFPRVYDLASGMMYARCRPNQVEVDGRQKLAKAVLQTLRRSTMDTGSSQRSLSD
jgi:hypothetical protein